MTYNMFGGTLNLALSICLSIVEYTSDFVLQYKLAQKKRYWNSGRPEISFLSDRTGHPSSSVCDNYLLLYGVCSMGTFTILRFCLCCNWNAGAADVSSVMFNETVF